MTITLNQKQMNFLRSTSINTGFCAGLGSGKSFVATLKTIIKKIENPEMTVAYYLPTYGLIRDIAFDKFPTMLSEMGYKYKLNKSDKEIHIENYGKIIFRGMDNPETIVGYEVFYSIIDECDILNQDKMTIAYNKIMARNRQKHPDGKLNQIDVASTPEGFKWFYQRYVKEFNSETDLLVRASTYDNKHLPEQYILNLEQQYPLNLLKAYLNGEFVNLAQGIIFDSFKRDTHNTDRILNDYENILIGQDFNIGSCISIVYVQEGNTMYAVDEYNSSNTQMIIENTLEKYPNRNITFFPDASGHAGKTNAAKSDIAMLRDAGFNVNAPLANGRVRDRINATNNAFEKGLLYVNVEKCPVYTESLEQHAYDDKGEPEKFNKAGSVDDYTDAGTYPVVRLLGIAGARVSSYQGNFL